MKQQGVITNILDNNNAMVLVKRHYSCEGCNACKMGTEEKTLEIEAINRINATIGEVVAVDMEHQNVLKAAFIIYALPLITLILGISLSMKVLGQMGINNSELFSALIGFVFMGITFLLIRQNDSKFRSTDEYIPVITEIIESEVE